jgi:ATP-binding cassette subfamily C protein/ATP-binding cassette subfamily C protein CydC
MADLLEVTKGRATLLITHKLRGLDQVDEIVVLEAGKIAGRGIHQALLGECPLYRQMWEAEQDLTAAF